MSYDLVIRNGQVVDGSGLPAYRADVGVVDGRISKIGRITDPARAVIDAEGHVVTPGFIDGHTHMDAQVMWDPLGTCSCWHGVTTVVMGNCGFTLAPAHSDARSLVVRNLERAEDISPAAMAAGIDWSWESYPEYLDSVDARPKGINYAGYVGHSALRTWAMGERAFSEPASDDDLELMERGLRQALEAGAIGLSTSRSDQHETPDDRPVASRLATWEEIRRLVGVMEARGGGIFELALENAVRSPDPAQRAEFHGRLRDLAVSSGVTFTFGVIPGSADETPWRDLLHTLDTTAAAGGRMIGQSHSRGIISVLSFRTRLPFDKLPEWAAVRHLAPAEQQQAFANPDCRKRLVYAAHHGDYGRAIGAEARTPRFDAIQIFDRGLPPHPGLADVAAAQGVDPVELMLDLAVSSDFDQLFLQPISFTGEEALLAIMRHPRTVMTFSDSGAHVSQIMDASISTHLLGHWVRDRQVFTLEEGIRMLTLAPAISWGFSDRGLVREGMVADLNVLDPERIGPDLPVVVDDLPGGSRRLSQKSSGILATVVAGEVLIKDRQHTGALPGRLLHDAR